jgi:Tol biopolymer transport system component
MADGYQPRFSPDGTKIAYAVPVQDGDEYEADIWVMNRDGSGATQLTDTGKDSFPFWNREGTKIYFRYQAGADDGDLYWMDTDGGGRESVSASNPRSGDFHPILDLFVAGVHTTNWEIHQFNRDGAGETTLVSGAYGNAHPDYSPDGAKMIFHTDRDGDAEIYGADADGNNQINLTQSSSGDDVEPRYSPNGGEIVFASDRDAANEYRIYLMSHDGTAQSALTASGGGVSERWPDWGPAVY